MKKAVFLDKDGTLLEDVPYNVEPGRIRLAPFAAQALKRLQDQHFVLIIVSNQSGVALGLFAESSVIKVKEAIFEMLEDENVFLYDFYFCPHLPNGRVPAYSKTCQCRKPAPGMLLKAAKEHEIDLAHSWMIGDILDDVEAGNRAGCKTILIDNGNETEWMQGPGRTPHFIADDLKEAASIILKVME